MVYNLNLVSPAVATVTTRTMLLQAGLAAAAAGGVGGLGAVPGAADPAADPISAASPITAYNHPFFGLPYDAR